MVIGFCLLAIAPSLLHLAGVDFGAPMHVPTQIEAATAPAVLHRALHGSLIHALLEWSAVAVACFTVMLALAHIRHKPDDTTLVIALALFASGCVDAFHTLAATHLITGAADSTNFIPFTWALSRLFHVTILIVGSLLLLESPPGRASKPRKVAAIAAMFAVLAYALVHLCATSPVLPETMHPNALITRPWDVGPLVLFVIAGLFVFPALHRRHRSSFTQALWLSVIPDVITEAHMSFGSSELFDSHFQMAHFTKVIAYAVPLSGLVLDYARAYRRLAEANERLEHTAEELELRAEELELANTELEQFAYVASHDLRAPLRAIDNLSSWLAEDLGDSLTGESAEHLELMRGRVKRMDDLLSALLSYSRVGRSGLEPTSVEVAELVEEIDAMYVAGSGLELVVVGELPKLRTDVVALRQVLANLVANAVKHRDERSARVEIRCADQGDRYRFTVSDDGPGIEPRHRERVFEMFQTLKPRDEVEGSGMGLALVKKQVLACGGSVELEAGEPRGAVFHFTWPKTWKSKPAHV